MHEASMAMSILHIVEDEARKHNVEHINKVRLHVGILVSVEAFALSEAFSVVAEDGIADGAELIVERTPAQAHCNQCNYSFDLSAPFGSCPSCHGSDLALSGGLECIIFGIDADTYSAQ